MHSRRECLGIVSCFNVAACLKDDTSLIVMLINIMNGYARFGFPASNTA